MSFSINKKKTPKMDVWLLKGVFLVFAIIYNRK